ncbi:MAG: OadG family protein [Chromatiales bacterium]|nr:OadG family protein [Chromatiales bacterium]
MPISDLLMEGVNLMLIGMGMVFVFLAILVVAMNGMSRLAKALIGDEVQQPSTPTAAVPQAGAGDEEVTAVIAAAISRFRSAKK